MGRSKPAATTNKGNAEIMDGEARAMLMALPSVRAARQRTQPDAAALSTADKPATPNSPWGTASWICT